MAKFCTNCGKEIADGVSFCTECGAPRSNEPAAQPVKAETQQYRQPTYTPPPAYAPPRQAAAPTPTSNSKAGVVGTGTFFGLQFLFAVPLIGWVACLIAAFIPKNKNIKNYARAMLIWIIIGIVLSVALSLLVKWLGGAIADYTGELSSSANGALGGFGDIFKQLGELSDAMKQLPEGTLENLPVK